jgi:hypothetical protein
MWVQAIARAWRLIMKRKNAERLRELAQQCVAAAHRSPDEDASATFLEIAFSLFEMANGKAKPQNQPEPAFA